VRPIACRGPRSSAACRPTRASVARHTRKAFLEPTAGLRLSGSARPVRGLTGRQSPLSYFSQFVVLTTGSTSDGVPAKLAKQLLTDRIGGAPAYILPLPVGGTPQHESPVCEFLVYCPPNELIAADVRLGPHVHQITGDLRKQPECDVEGIVRELLSKGVSRQTTCSKKLANIYWDNADDWFILVGSKKRIRL
jgi:hypothetical protein